jgi:hypothetical protein
MSAQDNTQRVIIDLNNAAFQHKLLNLQKHDRHSAMETLKKLHQMTWAQVYRDNGLKWEKIVNAVPPAGASALYSLRITQSCRATAYRDGNFLRFMTIHGDHDATYGKK